MRTAGTAPVASSLPPRFTEDSSSETKIPKDPKGSKDSKDGKKPKKPKLKKEDEDEKITDDGSEPVHSFQGHDDDDEDGDEGDGPTDGCKKKPGTKGSRASTSKKPAAGGSAVMKRPASRRKGSKASEDTPQACPEHTHTHTHIDENGISHNIHVKAIFMHCKLRGPSKSFWGTVQPFDCGRKKNVSLFSI